MNPYCAELNLNVYPLKDNFDPFALPQIIHQNLDLTTYLNPEISKLLNPLGVYIAYMEAFSFWQPYSQTYIHIDYVDYNNNSDVIKLNWIFGGADSSNQWFLAKPDAHGTSAVTPAKTGSIRYNLSEIEKLLFTYPAAKNPFIFQAGIPHKSCIGKEKRCCISMLPRWINTGRSLTFQETTDLLSNYLI
jgi:hypothetical protein